MQYITNSPAETEAIGAALGKILTPGTVIAYRGDLGAGKTPSPGAWQRAWAAGKLLPALPIPSSMNIWEADCLCSISICTG